MEEIVKVEDLAVSFFTYAGEVQAVRGISFDVKKGKTTALVGESGCGKSVTSKSLLGLIEKPGVVKDGKILFNGENILEFSPKQWNAFRGKECSMIFQDALVSLNPTMKVGKQIIENLANHNTNKLSKAEMKVKAIEMLELVGIPDAVQCLEKYPHELSGGMQQRVMIAMALMLGPDLIIADEPTTALDVTLQAQVLKLMRDLWRANSAILLITHDLGVVSQMATRIAVMKDARIVETADDVPGFFAAPKHPYSQLLIAEARKMEFK